MTMDLPKHTCISCAYLWESGTTIISHSHRESALDDKKWNRGHINYERLICHMGRQNFSDFNKNYAVIDIRNEVIKPNKCKHWTKFIGISPTVVEQRKSFKWGKFAFCATIATLVIALITWVLTQFVFDQLILTHNSTNHLGVVRVKAVT